MISNLWRFMARKDAIHDHGGGGGFSLASEDFWENVRPLISRLRFFSFLFFSKWRLARAHKFHSLCQDQSTVAQRAETTVAECSLTSCV